VRPAQWFFGGVYLATQACALALTIRTKTVPPLFLPLLAASKRLHSIFVLRCFNDGVATLGALVATLLLTAGRWTAAVAAYSAAVSVKMNVLLMAPPVAVVLLQGATPAASARAVGAGVALQLALGAPFLATHPASYLSRAFELTRVFFFKWSVNWAFLPESVFLSKPFALLLLATHLTSLAAFAHWRWTSDDGGLPGAVAGWWASGRGKRARAALAPAHVARAVAAGNFIGIACARSLHYQFYAWYAHTLPLLLWGTRLPVVAKLGLWAVVEAAWNIFPPTPAASLSLLAAHGVLLAALFLAPAPGRALATGKLKRR
jgi:alpha-1,3-mannosyltransferase